MGRGFYIDYTTYYAYNDCDIYKGYFYTYYYCIGIFHDEYEFTQEVVYNHVHVSVDTDRRPKAAAAIRTWGSCPAAFVRFE